VGEFLADDFTLCCGGEGVTMWKLPSFLFVRALRSLLHLGVRVQRNVGEVLLDIDGDFTLCCVENE